MYVAQNPVRGANWPPFLILSHLFVFNIRFFDLIMQHTEEKCFFSWKNKVIKSLRCIAIFLVGRVVAWRKGRLSTDETYMFG